jgi:hypothetical protein
LKIGRNTLGALLLTLVVLATAACGGGDACNAFKSAVSGASGYSVRKSEHEDFDAEVNFAGGNKTGQVKLLQSCKDRTEVTITARPK